MRVEKQYSAAQVQGMVIDPYVKGNVTDAYPFLKELGKDAMGFNPDKYWRYIALVYDPQSPMVKEYADIRQRKKEAARQTDFRLDYEKDYRYLAIDYLRCTNSLVAAELATNDNLFWQYVESLDKPITGLDDDKMLKAVEQQGKMTDMLVKFRERSAALRKELFGGDDALETAEQERLRPEDIAKLRSLNRNAKQSSEK